MKIFSMVILFMLVTIFAFADITSNQGEQKAIGYVKQIYTQLQSAKESSTQVYNKLKTYVLDHPTQFTASDKTKLNDLQAQLTIINNNIITFMTQVETNFSGIQE